MQHSKMGDVCIRYRRKQDIICEAENESTNVQKTIDDLTPIAMSDGQSLDSGFAPGVVNPNIKYHRITR